MTKFETMKSNKTRKPSKTKNTERFTVTEIVGARGSTWQVTGYKKTGERVRPKFKTYETATTAKQALDLEALGEVKQNLTELSPKQIKDATVALHILGHSTSLLEAATYFKANYKQVSGKPLPDTIAAYNVDRETTRIAKTGKKRSERTTYEIKSRLRTFESFMIERAIKAELGTTKTTDKEAMERLRETITPKLVDQISSQDIEAFLKDKGKSWNNYRTKLSGFFSWCIDQSICAINPVDKVERHGNEANKEYLSVLETKRLLEAAQSDHKGKYLAYTAIALFAGLRPDSELGKLTWKDVGLKSKKMRVPAGKTGKARAITISDNLLQWLETCDRTKPIMPEGSFQRGFAEVKRLAGFRGGIRDSKKHREIDDQEGRKPWVPDYTRHSFITYYMGKHSDIYKTATESGNSVEMVRDHYDGLIVDADAIDAYWAITPKSLAASKVVKFAV